MSAESCPNKLAGTTSIGAPSAVVPDSVLFICETLLQTLPQLLAASGLLL
jgi:hypothetical protein